MLLSTNSVCTAVVLRGRVHQQIQALAATNGVSAVWVARQAVVQHLSDRNGRVGLPLRSGRL